jgi:hypothetical protein
LFRGLDSVPVLVVRPPEELWRAELDRVVREDDRVSWVSEVVRWVLEVSLVSSGAKVQYRAGLKPISSQPEKPLSSARNSTYKVVSPS